jgi:hypothetical protein
MDDLMAKTSEQRERKPKLPKGYKTEAEFMSEMRDAYAQDIEVDKDNRLTMQEDIRFTFGEQWDENARERRERAKKPVLTVNRLPAYIAQVVGNRLLNETEIRVHPDNGGTKEVALIREALIRSIFKNSDADLARDEALKYQVIGGVGYYALEIDYASNDVFEQDIKIKHIPDPLSVVIDGLSTEPTGRDARRGFVCETMPRKVFEKKYPWASVTPFKEDNQQWIAGEDIRIASYWRMVEDGTKLLALMADGTVKTLADMETVEIMFAEGQIAARDDGEPYVREVPNRFAQMYLCSGQNILEGPYNLPCSTLPIFRVPAWELRDGAKTVRWGLVRYMKDPQRLHNYWRSVMAEQLVSAPRNKWAATREAVAGFEKDWRNSSVSDDGLLMYNAEGGMPQRIPPPQVDGALMNEAMTAVQDMRDVSNIHEAALGMKSNEVSGRAIQARQQITDLGTFIYFDRLRIADERCAEVINELIPTVYDTQRMVKIIGPDDETLLAVINDPNNPNSDVTLGKYAVTVTTGPATITKRALAAEQMMAFVNAVPESAAMVMDLVAEAQDWPKATEFARRFSQMLPPELKPQEEPTPEQMEEMQKQQEMQQMQEQMAVQMAQLEMEKAQAEIEETLARAEELRSKAAQNIANSEARLIDVESRVDDRMMKNAINIAERTE